MKKSRFMGKHELFVVLASTLWGTISIFKNMLSDLNLSETTVVFVRLFISAVVFGIYMFLKNPDLFKIKIRDLWCFFCTGIVSLFIFSLCYFKAMTLTSVGLAVTLLYTSPVFVTVMSVIFFKEKITRNKILAIIIAIFGCIMVTELFTQNLENLNISGILLGIMSGFSYALYSIFGKVAIKKIYSSQTITFYTFLFAFLGALPFCNFNEIISAIPTGNFWLGSLGISIVCCVLPYAFYTKGLMGTSSSKASVLAVIEPVVGTLTGILVFSETMSIYKLIGIVAVLSCTFLLKED